MAKTVVLNYTPEMTAKMREMYSAAPTKVTVDAIAALFGKTTKSVVAKLSREGVYVKAAYVSKTGAAPVKKDALVGVMASLIGVAEEKLDGLDKAPKSALMLIANALTAKAKGMTEGEATE